MHNRRLVIADDRNSAGEGHRYVPGSITGGPLTKIDAVNLSVRQDRLSINALGKVLDVLLDCRPHSSLRSVGFYNESSERFDG